MGDVRSATPCFYTQDDDFLLDESGELGGTHDEVGKLMRGTFPVACPRKRLTRVVEMWSTPGPLG